MNMGSDFWTTIAVSAVIGLIVGGLMKKTNGRGDGFGGVAYIRPVNRRW